MKLLLIACMFLGVASAADAETLSIKPGETVVVRFDGGHPVIERRGPAEPIAKYDAYAIWRAQTQNVPADAKTVPPQFLDQGEGPEIPASIPDRVQLTFRHVPALRVGAADHSSLVIANGYNYKFGYRALMRGKGRSVPTDVCEVPQKFRGVEHWPYVIDELDLSDLRLSDPATQINCE